MYNGSSEASRRFCAESLSSADIFTLLDREVFRFPDDPGKLAGCPVHQFSQSIRVPLTECERIGQQYLAMRCSVMSAHLKASLVSYTFDNWRYSDAHLLAYIRFMFVHLCLPELCSIPIDRLDMWLLAVYRRYNKVPFHNFKHAFTVTQMMFCVINQNKLDTWLEPLDLFILLFAALSHDLDHPGFSNSYQVNAGSWLALRYNDASPLENHHCAVAFDLISTTLTDLTSQWTESDCKWFRKAVIRCILATDMLHHAQCMTQLGHLIQTIDATDNSVSERCVARSDDRLTLMMMLLKLCDISNEARPLSVSDPWVDCLLEEFFHQARAEKRLGLPVAPFMDPEKVNRATSQLMFLSTTLIPLLQQLQSLLPDLKPLTVTAMNRLAHYHILSHPESVQRNHGLTGDDNRPVDSMTSTVPPESHVSSLNADCTVPCPSGCCCGGCCKDKRAHQSACCCCSPVNNLQSDVSLSRKLSTDSICSADPLSLYSNTSSSVSLA